MRFSIFSLMVVTLCVAVLASIAPPTDRVGAVVLCARVEFHNPTNYSPTIRMAWFLVNEDDDGVALYRSAIDPAGIKATRKLLGPPPLSLIGEDVSSWWGRDFPDPPHDWRPWKAIEIFK